MDTGAVQIYCVTSNGVEIISRVRGKSMLWRDSSLKIKATHCHEMISLLLHRAVLCALYWLSANMSIKNVYSQVFANYKYPACRPEVL
jgi:hypothetical protein